jgi:hypothetical protein
MHPTDRSDQTLKICITIPKHLRIITSSSYYINVPSFEIQNVFKMCIGAYPVVFHLCFPGWRCSFIITLCGRVTHVPIIIHGTSTKEEFEFIKSFENNTPFPLLLGKTWIEKDQIRRKSEEEATEKKNQELRDFIARKID